MDSSACRTNESSPSLVRSIICGHRQQRIEALRPVGGYGLSNYLAQRVDRQTEARRRLWEAERVSPSDVSASLSQHVLHTLGCVRQDLGHRLGPSREDREVVGFQLGPGE
jgi:hypothetical protein